jgi:hypothetical protein
LLTRFKNDENLRNYYLRYSKILYKVIKVAKKLYYKIKATWNFIKSEDGGSNIKEDKLNTINNSLRIHAENFNNHFLKIAESISIVTLIHKKGGKNNCPILDHFPYYHPFLRSSKKLCIRD